MSEDKRIISEQRTQLMQLREQLKQVKAGVAMPIAVARAMTSSVLKKSEGKTIGFKVSDSVRERVLAVMSKLGAKSYRQAVQACLEIGLKAVEEIKDDNAVEAVQVVQRPSDPGNNPVRANIN